MELRRGFFKVGKICEYLEVGMREKPGLKKRMNI